MDKIKKFFAMITWVLSALIFGGLVVLIPVTTWEFFEQFYWISENVGLVLVCSSILLIAVGAYVVFQQAFEGINKQARTLTILISISGVLFCFWDFYKLITVNGPGLIGIEYAAMLPLAIWAGIVGAIFLVKLYAKS